MWPSSLEVAQCQIVFTEIDKSALTWETIFKRLGLGLKVIQFTKQQMHKCTKLSKIMNHG